MRTSTLILIGALSSLACASQDIATPDSPNLSGVGNQPCTLEARAGISVVVRDAVTGAELERGVVAVARDGRFTDTLHALPTSTFSGVYERKGTYAVEVSARGYGPWRQDGVVVTADRCHVTPVSLRVALQPL